MSAPIFELIEAPEKGFELMVGWRFEQIHRFRRTVVMMHRSERQTRIKLTLPLSDLRYFRRLPPSASA